MDVIVNLKMLEMMRKLVSGDLQKVGGYPYVPQKTQILQPSGAIRLPRAKPASQGVSPAALQELVRTMGADSAHGLMVLRHGRVVYEGSWSPYRPDYSNMVYSLSKSITGLAVGFAVDEGLLRLDERIVDIFRDRAPLIRTSRINLVTVEHLLTMSSGVNFNECGTVLERDWVRAVLGSDCAFAPGSKFFYNSVNSYVLAACVKKRTGQTLTEYLTPRLWQPLGIPVPYWETCPMGCEKGGWGLYLTLEDMAKIGQLCLRHGVWTADGEEKRIISSRWIDESSSCRITSEKNGEILGYGYQMWMCPFPSSYQFNGAFGQHVVVMPAQDMVVALVSGARNMFADGKLSAAIRNTLLIDSALSDTSLHGGRAAQRSLDKTTASLSAYPSGSEAKIPYMRLLSRLIAAKMAMRPSRDEGRISGKSYALERSLCGFLPLALQCVHMNFSPGLSRVRFDFDAVSCTVTMHEGDDEIVITAGLDGKHRVCPVTVRGEKYAVACVARWTGDEYGRPTLIVYSTFVETPHMRIMTFVFDDNDIILKFSEWPTAYDAMRMLIELVGGPGSRIEQLVTGVTELDGIRMKIERHSEPRCHGQIIREEERNETEAEN